MTPLMGLAMVAVICPPPTAHGQSPVNTVEAATAAPALSTMMERAVPLWKELAVSRVAQRRAVATRIVKGPGFTLLDRSRRPRHVGGYWVNGAPSICLDYNLGAPNGYLVTQKGALAGVSAAKTWQLHNLANAMKARPTTAEFASYWLAVRFIIRERAFLQDAPSYRQQLYAKKLGVVWVWGARLAAASTQYRYTARLTMMAAYPGGYSKAMLVVKKASGHPAPGGVVNWTPSANLQLVSGHRVTNARGIAVATSRVKWGYWGELAAAAGFPSPYVGYRTAPTKGRQRLIVRSPYRIYVPARDTFRTNPGVSSVSKKCKVPCPGTGTLTLGRRNQTGFVMRAVWYDDKNRLIAPPLHIAPGKPGYVSKQVPDGLRVKKAAFCLVATQAARSCLPPGWIVQALNYEVVCPKWAEADVSLHGTCNGVVCRTAFFTAPVGSPRGYIGYRQVGNARPVGYVLPPSGARVPLPATGVLRKGTAIRFWFVARHHRDATGRPVGPVVVSGKLGTVIVG